MADEVEIERMVVRLLGDSQSYMKMMNDSKNETKKAQSELQQLGVKIEAVGAKIRNVGLGLSLAITTPLVGLGYAARNEFTEFEAALSRMEGLVGIAGDEVAKFREEILQLAGPVAKSPVELAKAMEFITGSGIKGNAALETLTITAKAASAGLGETVEVANAVTSAMNAYGPANLSAAKATDILVATVREGKAEASSFAPVFGQVLPLAAEMGISFGEVGGALAFLTRTTGNASIATTQLRSLMTQLLKPTEKSTKALEAMGISSADVSDMIKQKGLVTTINVLKERLAAAGLEVKDMITDTEGLMGALQFTGPQAKIAAEMIKTVEAAAGDTQKAFDAAAKTAKFTFAQAMAETKIALIELGEIIAPVLQQLISYQRTAMEAWKGLSNETKQTVVAFAAVAVTVGPTLVGLGMVASSIGTLIQAYAAVKGVITAYTVSVSAASLATSAMGVTIAGLSAALIVLTAKALYDANQDIAKFNEQLKLSGELSNNLQNRFNKETGNILKEASSLQGNERSAFLTKALQRAKVEMDGYKEHVKGAQREIDEGFKNPAGARAVGNKMIALLDQQSAEAKARLKGAQDRVQAIEAELAEVKKVQAEAKPEKAKFDTKELTKYTEGLQAQLGALKNEAEVGKELADSLEIQKFKLEGASESQLKLARDTHQAIEAQKKQNTLNQEAKDILKSLQDDVSGLGLKFGATDDEIKLYNLSLKGADMATLKEAHSLAMQKKELEKNKKLMEEGKELKKQWLSPSAKLKEEQTKLSKMLELGAIDIKTYNKALKEAEKQAAKDYKVEFKTSGADAVAAGSAEAMERLREYQYAISGAKPLPPPEDVVATDQKVATQAKKKGIYLNMAFGKPEASALERREIAQGGGRINESAVALTNASFEISETLNKGTTFLTIAEGIKRLVILAEQQNVQGEVVEFVTSGLSDIRG